MQFEAKEYFEAGLERMTEARKIYREGSSYALAIYIAGLAVECLLRGFRWQKQKTFEGRHDLEELFKASELLLRDEGELRSGGASEEAIRHSAARLRSALNVVAVLWHNNLRFASEAKLKSHLHRLGMLKKVKGNPLKKNALDVLEAAQTIINRGTLLWS